MNEQLTALYIRASILSRNAKDKTKEMVKNFFVDETGALTVVEIVIMIGIAVLLAIFFRDQISDVVKGLFDSIKTNVDDTKNGIN